MTTILHPGAEPARVREMIARGRLIGDLPAVRDVERELRIALEETLGLAGFVLYVARGTRLVPAGPAPAGEMPLVRQAARENRVVRGALDGHEGAIGAYPLSVGSRVVGVALADVREDAEELLMVLLDVAAQGLERALLLEAKESDRGVSQARAYRLALAHDLLRTIMGPLDPDAFFRQVVEAVRDGVGFQLVLLRLFDPEKGGYTARASVGLPREAAEQCYNRVVTLEEIGPLFAPKYQLSRSYFVSHRSPIWDGREDRVYTPDLGSRDEGEWQAEDCLLVPIVNGRGERLGYLSVDDPADRQTPSVESVGSVEIFADLAALALDMRGPWR